MEIAGLCNIHPNDAEASLQFLPYFYYRDAPGLKTLWNQLRENDIFELRQMYLATLERLIIVLDEYGYLPDRSDLALDLTNLMWYGRHSTEKDEDGKRLDRDDISHEDQPIGVEGVDQKASSSFAFQIASISLANVKMPVMLAAKSIQRRGSIEHQIDEMLTYAKHYVEPDVVCMDGGSMAAGCTTVSKNTASSSSADCAPDRQRLLTTRKTSSTGSKTELRSTATTYS